MAYNEGAASGNLVLIQSQIVSGVSLVEFKNIPSNFDILQFVAYGFHASGATYGRYQISYDNGVTYKNDSSYSSNGLVWDTTGSESFNVVETSGRWCQQIDNSANAQTACVTQIFGANSSSAFQVIKHNGGGNPSYGGTFDYNTYYAGSAGVLNAIKFFPNAGTFSGNFKLYGVQK